MTAICTSILDLFKIGPGPSSSHTIGPMKAGRDFLDFVRELPPSKRSTVTSVKVHLYGSLSATGDGHGTDKAVAAGLLGYAPETVPQDFMENLFESPADEQLLPLQDVRVPLRPDDIIFDEVSHSFPYNNTLIIKAHAQDGVVAERTYYSQGGGFISYEGEPEPQLGDPAYPYSNMHELKDILREKDMRLHEVILANEAAVHGRSTEQTFAHVDHIMDVMIDAVERGLRTEGVLPGCIGLQRKAPELLRRSGLARHEQDRFLMLLNAYAMGVAEENAAGHKVVTAPTSGSCGVIPSVVYAMLNLLDIGRQSVREGFLAAAAVGFLVKHNASIAGAEVGCQGEIGTASSMAAAMLSYAHGYRFQVTENAAEIALEHHLGLTCDPVGGYVQIPCIERNAMGVVKAYNAYLMATLGNPSAQVIDLDKTIWVMNQTGRDMNAKYKETSLGGLAVRMPRC